MQVARYMLLGMAVLASAGFPASACPNEKSGVHNYAPMDAAGGDTIRRVMRGDRIAIACDGIDLSDHDVRVVFNFSADGAKELGYKGVLATDQTNSDGQLRIRVPDAPDLANHTMSVKVFVLNGDDAATMCDAGKVRVT